MVFELLLVVFEFLLESSYLAGSLLQLEAFGFD